MESDSYALYEKEELSSRRIIVTAESSKERGGGIAKTVSYEFFYC